MSKITTSTDYRVLNCIPSKDLVKDWRLQDAFMASIAQPVALPPAIDLREPWWGINNQRLTGSCVGWAVADGLLRWHNVKTQVILPSQLLSVRFIWMSAKETDEFTDAPSVFLEQTGTSLKAALDVARKYGCVLEEVLPFGSGLLYGGPESEFFAIASRLKIANYFNLLTTNQPIMEWRQWLAAGNGPIMIRIEVDDNWWNLKEDGLLDVYAKGTVRGGHAVCIVGYTQDRIIIRNSWGDNWGDRGFAYASFEYILDAITEAYGISAMGNVNMAPAEKLQNNLKHHPAEEKLSVA